MQAVPATANTPSLSFSQVNKVVCAHHAPVADIVLHPVAKRIGGVVNVGERTACEA